MLLRHVYRTFRGWAAAGKFEQTFSPIAEVHNCAAPPRIRYVPPTAKR